MSDYEQRCMYDEMYEKMQDHDWSDLRQVQDWLRKQKGKLASSALEFVNLLESIAEAGDAIMEWEDGTVLSNEQFHDREMEEDEEGDE